MGVALLKFSQGATVGGNGRALVVAIGATPVTIENSTSGGGATIGSYKIELLYAPPDRTTPAGYALVPGVDPPLVLAQANGDTPSASLDMSEAAIYGCYRIRMTVWPMPNEAGTPDVDIRNVAVLTPNRALILPPYQKFPDPLPLEGVGAKPDEMNFENQGWGWSGPEYDAGTYPFRLVNEALKEIDTISGSILPVANYDGSMLFWTGSGWSFSDNDLSGVTTPATAVPVYNIASNSVSMIPVSDATSYGGGMPAGSAVLCATGDGLATWNAVRPTHMSADGSVGALYVINSDSSVVLASGPTPLDKYIPVWHTSLSPEIPQWKSVLYAIPDGGIGVPSIVYWGGSSWGITPLLNALPKVNGIDDGIVNDFPITGNYLLGSGVVGGTWTKVTNNYIDDATLNVGKLVAGTEGYIVKVVGGVVTWAVDAGGMTPPAVGEAYYLAVGAAGGGDLAYLGGTTTGHVAYWNGAAWVSSDITNSSIATGANVSVDKLAAGANHSVLTTDGATTPTWLGPGGNGTFLGISGGVLGYYAVSGTVPDGSSQYDILSWTGSAWAAGAMTDNEHGNRGGGDLHASVSTGGKGFAPIIPGAGSYVLVSQTGSPGWGQISDAFVSATAAIDVTKLGAGSNHTVLITNGSTTPTWLGPGTNGQFLGVSGGVLGFYTPPDIGEANTGSNVGTDGVGVFNQKTGVNLEFRHVAPASTKVTVVLNGQDIDIDVAEANIVHQNLSGAGTNTHAQIDTHIADTANPHATDIGNLGSGTLAELNTKVTDATLDTNTASRPPSGAASGDLGGTYPSPTVNDGADSTAIHDNVSAEISAITEKTTPVAADLLVIEDSAAGNAKKRVQVGNLPHPSTTYDISYVNSTETEANDDNTSITLNVPAGVQDGDVLIAIVCHSEADSNVMGAPDGWELIVNELQVGGTPPSPPGTSVWKRVASNEPASYFWTATEPASMAGQMLAYRGVGNVTWQDATLQTATGVTGSPNPPSITTVTDGAWVLAIGFKDDGGSAITATSSGYTQRQITTATQGGGGDNGCSLATCDFDKVTAGAENPGAFTSASDEWGAITLALRPGPIQDWREAGPNLTGINKVTFDSVYTITPASGVAAVNPDNGQKQQVTFTSTTPTINFISPVPNQPCNIMLRVTLAASTTSVTLQHDGVASDVWAAGASVDMKNNGTTMLGVYFDGSDVYLTSSPDVQASATVNLT